MRTHIQTQRIGFPDDETEVIREMTAGDGIRGVTKDTVEPPQ
jgi:hypothetical protein